MNIQLQFDSGEPLYLQLAREIRKLIIEGKLPVGTQVPTGRELGATLGISRQTTAPWRFTRPRSRFARRNNGKVSAPGARLPQMTS